MILLHRLIARDDRPERIIEVLIPVSHILIISSMDEMSIKEAAAHSNGFFELWKQGQSFLACSSPNWIQIQMVVTETPAEIRRQIWMLNSKRYMPGGELIKQ